MWPGSTTSFRFFVVALALVLACARVSDARAASTDRPLRIVVAHSSSPCADGGAPLPKVAAESDAIIERLRVVAGGAEVIPVGNGGQVRAPQLMATLARDIRPLWFIYSGHGAVRMGRSVLCLTDGELPVASVIGGVPAQTPFATFLLNACASAHVGELPANRV